MSIRIVLADDHMLFLDGLRALLEKQPNLEVIAAVNDGLETLRVTRETLPDLILMDVSMPGMNGIEATSRISAEAAGVKVLCLSMYADQQFVLAVLDAGASGYLLKNSGSDELITAIHAVLANHTYLSPAIAGLLVQGLKERGTKRQSSPFSCLNHREREVLQLIVESHSNKAIATRLHLSIKTIHTHREHLMDKLNIHSVAGLTKYAVRHGLTTIESLPEERE